MSVRASVVIPCHNKPLTLPLTVDSVLRQSVTELEVLLLGDGVTDEVRRVVEELMELDQRVRFLDFPKGPHHGEAYRHQAVLEARSEAIFYLCDDDLFLPEHVADLLGLLEHANLVQSLNGYILPDGSFRTYATDLSDPRFVEPMLDDSVRFNAVTITGTAHSRSFYLDVGEPWETTPPGMWPDHHQWRRMMRHPAFRGATSTRMTALQLPTTQGGRHRWSQEERVAELAVWHELVCSPGAQAEIEARYRQGAFEHLALALPQLKRWRASTKAARSRTRQLRTRLRRTRARNRALRKRQARLQRQLHRARRERDAARAELLELRSSRSWRVTAPLRAASASARRLRRS